MSDMTLEWRNLPSGVMEYKLLVPDVEIALAKLTDLDRALLNDIDNGPLSKTPVADKLLGLETIVRHIEENKS